MKTNYFAFDVKVILCLESTFPDGRPVGRPVGRVGEAEAKTNSA